MSFIAGQTLLEYAIRIGVDDLLKDQTLVNLAFFTDPQQNLGADMTPAGSTTKVNEPLPTDIFQQRLSEIQRSKAETGQSKIFQNMIPAIPDIWTYLQSANMAIRHGFPREAQDLPCLAITLGNEDENQYLGANKGVISVVDPSSPTKETKRYGIIGSDWPTQYQIRIMTPNYDETEIWYFILKYCFSVYRVALGAYGLREIAISFGDLEPADEYIQSGLFIYQRICTIACVKEEDVPIPTPGLFTSLGFSVDATVAGEYHEGDGTIIPDPAP